MLLALGAAAPRAQNPPAPVEPAEFLARDSHQDVTFAARPVPDTPEAERLFGKNAALTRGGFLPVEIFILNRRAEPVQVRLERIVVETDPENFPQVSPQEIAGALYPPPKSKQPTQPGRIPRPPEDKNRAKREEAEAALRSRQLRAAVVGPGGQARGYLYFDLRGAELELSRARLYVPEVVVLPIGEALLFFEISLAPYAR